MNESSTSVRRQVTVPATPELAFEVFTTRLADWWPGHRIGAQPAEAFVLEPGPQGRWYERGTDGTECEWGRVVRWEPPRRVTLTWEIDASWQRDPDRASEVDVTFEDTPGGTLVTLVHSSLERAGDGWESMRDAVAGPAGWGPMLARVASLVPTS